MMTHEGTTIPKSANTLPLAAVRARRPLEPWPVRAGGVVDQTAGEGQLSAQGALVAKNRRIHRPLAPGQVHRSGTTQTEAKVDWGSCQPAPVAGGTTRQTRSPDAGRRARSNLVCAGLARRGGRRPAPSMFAWSPSTPGTICSRRTCSSAQAPKSARAIDPGLDGHRPAQRAG